jgi:transcriptional regulator with XRE-family HTH domain
MPARLSPARRGHDRGTRLLADLCREAESARLELGLSYADVGRALGVSGEHARRICQGRARSLGLVRLSELLAVLGRDLGARSYPGGPPIRDAPQLALIGRLEALLPAGTRATREAPVVSRSFPNDGSGPFDQRAWDVVLQGPTWRLGVEAETRLHDIQSLLRRITLKQRDGDVDHVVLIVNDTANNRAVVRAATGELRVQFPAPARTTLARLRAGTALEANALLLL